MVFLTHNYPRHAGDLPGAFLQPLARALRDRGHDLRIVAPSDRGRGGRELLEGIPVRRVRYGTPERETLAYQGRMQEAVRSPAGLLALARLVRALRAGARAEARSSAGEVVIHAHWWIPAGLALPAGVPSLVTLHGTDGRILRRSALARWLGRRVLRRARVVSAVSPELAEIAERVRGRSDVARHVQPMPVESAERPWSTGGEGALVVARLVRQKRVELAISAAGELARSGAPIPLTIVGDGPERAALERLAALLPNEASVRFSGTLSPAGVTQRFAKADLLLFPAREEGLGLAAVEALMSGVPVIACSDGGGLVSALGKYGGGIVTAPTPAALAAAVGQAAAIRAAAREAGARWRAELTPARVAEVFEGWYREALSA
ncbi:MAG TPA: glycosyltransferase family 4 protein [Gemmatimonadales bacterium]|nr:glycosyltransferase family 4 protein [Gemmatimonadales bacterium]